MGPVGTTAKQIATTAGGFLGGPVGGILGNIVGGVFGRSGQNSANQANLRIARENREWQEKMSNTAMQRSAADMEKAGLNRILAIGQPATTPAGNIATIQNKNAKLAEGITSGITAGLTAKRLKAEIRNINARTNLTDAQRSALTPAATLGQGVGDALTTAERNLSPDNIDYQSMWSTTAKMAKDKHIGDCRNARQHT